MNCEEFMKLLGFYVDGQLPRQYLEDFEMHLKVCNLCMVEFNKLKRYKQKIAEIPPSYAAPEEVKQSIISAITALKLENTVELPAVSKKRDSKEIKQKVDPGKNKKPEKPENAAYYSKNFIWYFFIVIAILLLGFLTIIRFLHK